MYTHTHIYTCGLSMYAKPKAHAPSLFIWVQKTAKMSTIETVQYNHLQMCFQNLGDISTCTISFKENSFKTLDVITSSHFKESSAGARAPPSSPRAADCWALSPQTAVLNPKHQEKGEDTLQISSVFSPIRGPADCSESSMFRQEKRFESPLPSRSPNPVSTSPN